MKKILMVFPVVALLTIGLSSCGEVCVRCENGANADIKTECFGNDDERDEYVAVYEAIGYTCNDK